MSRSCTREGDETGRLAIAPTDVKAVDPAATVAIATNVAVAVVDAVAIAVANALALALALAENYVNPRKNVQNGLVEFYLYLMCIIHIFPFHNIKTSQ
ncbi:hypothetical protein HZH66_004165 [Vespula vulgaris]|uniref:Uncharacterized protein n=1 Tax=Vespula vulgaris TaxID=7454 RepID=A0A834NEL5_VESVU|nr:hypothetical protein HZH66_004165 [Vespula vulgaris]